MHRTITAIFGTYGEEIRVLIGFPEKVRLAEGRGSSRWGDATGSR